MTKIIRVVIAVRRLLWILALAATIAAAQAGELKFVDKWNAGELPAYGRQCSPLVAVKPTSLTAEPQYPPGTVRYATFSFRDDANEPVLVISALVTPPDGQAILYVDSNADGVLEAGERAAPATPERRPLGLAKPQKAVWVAPLYQPRKRMVAFTMTSFDLMLGCAVRGYAQATLPVAGNQVRAVFVDVDANMLLEQFRDAVYVDVNGDGQFDGETECFPLVERVAIGPAAFSIAKWQPLEAAAWESAPVGAARVEFVIGSLPVEPESVLATIGSLTGGIFQITALNKEMELPAGTYTAESLIIQVPGCKANTMTYAFSRSGLGTVMKVGGEETTFDLLGDMSAPVSFDGEPRPGAKLSIAINPRTSTGMILNSESEGNEISQRSCSSCGITLPTTVTLIGPEGAELARVDSVRPSCCGTFAGCQLTVPADAKPGEYTIKVVYDLSLLGQNPTGEKKFSIEE